MKQIISAFAFLLLFTTQNQAAIWYVNLSATGTNSGTSWANACTDIGSALSNSNAGDEIWVAAGTYKPSASNQTVYYDLKADVAIYGGFNGTETVISQRNFTTNATTISGDIGTPGFPNDNTYHLFKATNLSVVSTVDGFRIRDGVAYYLGLPHTFGYQGGAALISNSQVKFANCNFNNNTAQAGGAIYATSSTLTIDKCTFRGNSASFTNGGAIYSQSSNLNITRTNFISNSTTAGAGPADGGGIYIGSGTTPSTINIDRCLFTNNSTTHMGSCIKAFAYNGVIDITNCIMVGNYSKYGSVIELIGTSSPSFPSTAHISNCTMTMNSADTSSLTYHPIQLTATNKKIENSIVWNNTATTQLDTGYTVKNCLVEGGYSTGTNILNLNPNFINPPVFNNLPFIGNISDYRLNLLSPAINTGDNAFALTTLDINDSVRIQNTNVDLGAIENAHCTFPLNLNVTPNDTLCAGQVATITASGGHMFSWSTGSNTNSINVSTSGNYSLIAVDTITQCRGNNSASIYIQTPVAITIQADICYNSSYTFPSGVTLNHILTNMIDTSYLTTINGCDSLVIVQLNILPAYTLNQNISICPGSNYTFPDGTTQTNIVTPVTQASLLSTTYGCDSIIYTNIQINPIYSINQTDSICYGSNYTFPDGSNIGPVFSPTSHTSLLTTLAGCDSTIITSLSVMTIDTSVTQAGSLLTANASGVTYQWIWCDFQYIIPGATTQNYTAGWSGQFSVILSNGLCTDTSNCHLVQGVDIKEITENDISIYPNPFENELVIDLKNLDKHITSVEVSNSIGKIISKEFYHQYLQSIKIPLTQLSSGFYFITLYLVDGTRMTKKIVKN